MTANVVFHRPTADQILFAMEYMQDSGLSSVMVAVVFPNREAVMDGDDPAIWTDRHSALDALNDGFAGNAVFRVYSDGHTHCIGEKD